MIPAPHNSSDDCVAACCADDGCMAWSFTQKLPWKCPPGKQCPCPYDSPCCFLKNAYPNLNAGAGIDAVSGYKAPATINCTECGCDEGYESFGHDFHEFVPDTGAAGKAECAHACCENVLCQSYTYETSAMDSSQNCSLGKPCCTLKFEPNYPFKLSPNAGTCSGLVTRGPKIKPTPCPSARVTKPRSEVTLILADQ